MKRPKTFQCALLAAAFTLYLAGSVVGVWGSMVGLAVLVGLRKNLNPFVWIAPFLLIGIIALPSNIVGITQLKAQLAIGHDTITNIPKIASALNPNGANVTMYVNEEVLTKYDGVAMLTMPLVQILGLVGTAPATFILSLFIWSRLKKHVFALIPELNMP